MNLAQALKQKNRLAGEIARQQQIFARENSRRNDNTSTIDREAVWKNILDLAEKLATIKSKITQANVNIYPTLERMAEMKSRIAFITGLESREGEERDIYATNTTVYRWDSFINQSKKDVMIEELQAEINQLQDKVDAYNGTTLISE